MHPATEGNIPKTCGTPSKWVSSTVVSYPDPGIEDAINFAITQGIICVASAGNRSLNFLTGVPTECDPSSIPYILYPAAFDNVIAVSATKQNGSTEEFVDGWNYSQANWIDVSAPGYNILTTDDLGDYTFGDGTSFSAPLTSALCGLILSVNNSLTVNQVYNILINSTDKIGQYAYVNGWNRYMGYGRINAYKALKYTLENYGGTLTQNLTIPSGETWNFTPGVTVKFAAGTYLTVNGTLNAVGTPSNKITFDRSGTTGTWGGLVFNNSFMNINNCNIYHATYGVKCDNPFNGPNIQNCTIASCGTGIYATNYYGGTISNNNITGCMTGIYLYNIPPIISGNTISGNAYYGINCNYYSSPYIYENSIQSVQTAISCNTYSNIRLTTQSNGPGFNEIIANSKGVYSNFSTPFLGSSSVHGNNYFENSTKYIEAYNSGVIWAQYNCWSPYDVNKFYAGSGTTIYHSPYDCSFLNKSASISDNENISTGLEEALNLELTGNFEQALDLYKKIFELQRDTKIGRYCFVKISDCYLALNKSGLDEYLTNILTEKNTNTELDAVRIELINRDLMKDRKFDEVLVNLNKISSNNSYSTEIRKNNVFNTALLYLNCYNNYSKAKEIFNEFSKQYPDDKLNLDAELLMIAAFPEEHQNSLAKETKTENQTIDNDNNVQYSLSDCYPNPFNPSTVINYSVKDAGLVKIKIYDILGSEIAELVNEIKESGNHSVEFNASNLPSGVYIYTLRANRFSASRKMLLLK